MKLLGSHCAAGLFCAAVYGSAWAGGGAVFSVNAEAITEASGVAVSRHDANILWTHNDSGDWATLYAVTTSGAFRGSIDVLGANAVDWEDMAAFTLNGERWLLIADVGDNFGLRDSVTLYFIAEPDITGLADGFVADADVTRQMVLRYEDGPRDVEAVAVDAPAGYIYLLSKRDEFPQLYRVALPSLQPGDTPTTPQVAKHVATLRHLPGVTQQDLQNDPRYGLFRNQPTALDISPDGQRWLITTYKEALLYQRQPEQSLTDMFAHTPTRIALPQLPQLEAGALDYEHSQAYFITEGNPATLLSEPLPPR